MNILPRAPKRYRRYRHEKRYDAPLLIFFGDLFFNLVRASIFLIPVALVLIALKYFDSKEPQIDVAANTSTPVLAKPTPVTIEAPLKGNANQVASPPKADASTKDSESIAVATLTTTAEKAIIESTINVKTELRIVDEEWIDKLDPASFIIQFGTAIDVDLLEEFFPVINQGDPIAVYPFKTTPSGEPVFGVATGVFEDRDEALSAVKNLPNESSAYKPWVRPIAELKQQITATKSRIGE